MKKSKISGLLFILFAILFLFSNYLPPEFKNIISFKTILSFFFIYLILENLFSKNYDASIVFFNSLYFINFNAYLNRLGFPRPSIVFISSVLLLIGLKQLFPKKSHYKNTYQNNKFGQYTTYVDSQALENYELKTIFAENTYYFDKAIAKHQHVNLDVSTTFSEVTIYIPKNWRIIQTPKVIFGEFKIHGNSDTFDVQLHITGKVLFSQVRIIYI